MKNSRKSSDRILNSSLTFNIRRYLLGLSFRVCSFWGNKKRRRLRVALLFLRSLVKDNIIGIAAQTAYFLLLSLFPLTALASTILAKNLDVLGNELFSYLLPESVARVLLPVINEIGELSGAPLISVLLSLWSGSTGNWELMRGICKAFTGNYPEKAIAKRIVALLFVVVFLLVMAFGLSLWVYFSSLLSRTDGAMSTLAYPMKYVGVFLGILIFILCLYAYTPGYDLNNRNLVPGAVAASVGWILASVGFEVYINHFSNYSAIYGGIGAFLGLLIWMFVISAVILVGAEINAAVFLYREEG